ncbi:hypothetical protein KM043_000152 [Ampulex compressa]|nr:hypothetical protein KM043_000152 [Ampulex compressa]
MGLHSHSRTVVSLSEALQEHTLCPSRVVEVGLCQAETSQESYYSVGSPMSGGLSVPFSLTGVGATGTSILLRWTRSWRWSSDAPTTFPSTFICSSLKMMGGTDSAAAAMQCGVLFPVLLLDYSAAASNRLQLSKSDNG